MLIHRISAVIQLTLLLAIVSLLAHYILFVTPMNSAKQTYLAVMAECSHRRLAAMAEIKAGAEKAMAEASEDKREQIQQSLSDSYGTLNSSDFYQKCADTVKKDWSL